MKNIRLLSRGNREYENIALRGKFVQFLQCSSYRDHVYKSTYIKCDNLHVYKVKHVIFVAKM